MCDGCNKVRINGVNFVFCQFDTRFLYAGQFGTLSDKYYNRIWETKEQDGYYKPDSFWELPLWIAEIDGLLSKEPNRFQSELKIIQSENDFDLSGENVYFCFSVLDINKQYVKRIIEQNPGKLFMLGGYVNPNEFKVYKNAYWHNTIDDFKNRWSIKSDYELSYRLFKGTKCMPRLTLSTGCSHNCKFCMIENTVQEVKTCDVDKQLDAMQELNYKLVYVNDKTFGQAGNYQQLKACYAYLKRKNPAFKGFIVQTTAQQARKTEFVEFMKQAGVFACEIGVESWNDRILKQYRKPHNERMICKSMDNLYNAGIKIIPNIIIGLLGESISTYNNTLDHLDYFKDYIYLLNIYNLAIYQGSDLYQEIPSSGNDTNENSTEKSFYSDIDVNRIHYFYNKIFNFGLGVL